MGLLLEIEKKSVWSDNFFVETNFSFDKCTVFRGVQKFDEVQ